MSSPSRSWPFAGRRRGGGAVERSVTTAWWRWWGVGVLAAGIGLGLPLTALNSYRSDQSLREDGEQRTVEVVAVDDEDRGLNRFTVVVDGREVTLDNPEIDHEIGQQIAVVVGDGRVILADDAGALDEALGPGLVWPALLLAMVLGLGWGPGLGPYRAVKALRVPGAQATEQVVTILAADMRRAPQGRLYTGWRRGGGRFYEMQLRTTDRRALRWCGRADRPPKPGSPAMLVGGSEPGDWAVLVVNVADTDNESVWWPATTLAPPGDQPMPA